MRPANRRLTRSSCVCCVRDAALRWSAWRAALFALPGRGAFFEEGGGAFGFVGGGAERAEEFGFAAESGFKGQVESFIDGAEGGGDGEGRIGGDLVGEGFGAGHEFGGGVNFVDEADAEGFLCRDDFAGEQQLERGAAAGEAGEALGAAVAGHQAELDFGLAEAGGVRGEAEGAGHGEFAAAAEGEAVDAGEDGLATSLNEAEDGLAAQGELLAGDGAGGGDFADVGARGEGLAARASEEDDADGGVLGEAAHGVGKLGEERGVERIEHRGPIQGEGGNGRAQVKEDVDVIHGGSRVADGGVVCCAGGQKESGGSRFVRRHPK